MLLLTGCCTYRPPARTRPDATTLHVSGRGCPESVRAPRPPAVPPSAGPGPGARAGPGVGRSRESRSVSRLDDVVTLSHHPPRERHVGSRIAVLTGPTRVIARNTHDPPRVSGIPATAPAHATRGYRLAQPSVRCTSGSSLRPAWQPPRRRLLPSPLPPPCLSALRGESGAAGSSDASFAVRGRRGALRRHVPDVAAAACVEAAGVGLTCAPRQTPRAQRQDGGNTGGGRAGGRCAGGRRARGRAPGERRHRGSRRQVSRAWRRA